MTSGAGGEGAATSGSTGSGGSGGDGGGASSTGGQAGDAGGHGDGGAGGAGGHGDGGHGDGGAGGFTPCPTNGEPCKILPLGDSITDGVGVQGGGGYRIELFRKARAAGKKITFVGSLMNGPATVDGASFPRAHEGHSGWKIDQIGGWCRRPRSRRTRTSCCSWRGPTI
ncbi:hypothetical protein WMF27_22915 [Sorangium sp. So ce281]|uniref:hypothetical protein n=1 Tax=unclassified Sorangium TaxID=2621164 RepID=UPI003F5E7E23